MGSRPGRVFLVRGQGVRDPDRARRGRLAAALVLGHNPGDAAAAVAAIDPGVSVGGEGSAYEGPAGPGARFGEGRITEVAEDARGRGEESMALRAVPDRALPREAPNLLSPRPHASFASSVICPFLPSPIQAPLHPIARLVSPEEPHALRSRQHPAHPHRPDHPMGDLFRRFWHPVLLSANSRARWPSLRVTVLGEDLRAFRATDGSVGLVSHAARTAAPISSSAVTRTRHKLRLSRLEIRHRRTLPRAAHHGPRPARERTEENVRLLAYPTREAGGFIWAYLGRANTNPRCLISSSSRSPPPISSPPKSSSNATGRRPARAGSTPRISPSCI